MDKNKMTAKIYSLLAAREKAFAAGDARYAPVCRNRFTGVEWVPILALRYQAGVDPEFDEIPDSLMDELFRLDPDRA